MALVAVVSPVNSCVTLDPSGGGPPPKPKATVEGEAFADPSFHFPVPIDAVVPQLVPSQLSDCDFPIGGAPPNVKPAVCVPADPSA